MDKVAVIKRLQTNAGESLEKREASRPLGEMYIGVSAVGNSMQVP